MEALDALSGRLTELPRSRRVEQEIRKSFGQAGGALGPDEDAGVTERLGRTGHVARDDARPLAIASSSATDIPS